MINICMDALIHYALSLKGQMKCRGARVAVSIAVVAVVFYGSSTAWWYWHIADWGLRGWIYGCMG